MAQFRILDIEQALLLLELEPPFGQRDVQLQRRRLAKRWHPDIAPIGKRSTHQQHLQAINEAADQLERLAEQSRGGRVSVTAVKASSAAARKARAEAGERAYEEQQRTRESKKYDPFGNRVPDTSVVHRYARCLSYPEWGVGNVTGIYFSDNENNLRQWARVRFQVGVRTVPAGSLQFVDFSKPDPATERMERFLIAAQQAMAESNYGLAAKRLVYARDAQPENVLVLRLMTLAYWQSGNLDAAARSVRDWIRVENAHPAPYRFAARIYEQMGALELAIEAAVEEMKQAPTDASAWMRIGRLKLQKLDRYGARAALERAMLLGPSVGGLLDLALIHHLNGDVGAEVSVCEIAVELDPESPKAWVRYAHALARTDRVGDCIEACERALRLEDDGEVETLLARIRLLEARQIHQTVS